ncbi:MAG TPA: tetratricopeptide repeat protein [Patescibacteria group bacterium]|nr:tetratricopeptide repeat protein [Patescibacteria group bacterium]
MELLLDAEDALALGLLDRAERTYRSVLDADPRNGIAAVGLSRVALERGDDAGALALARAALEIDPDNATARRMIERLEEVARHRVGAAATDPESSTDGQRPGGAASMNTPPSQAQAAPDDAPARPGLLRRILRRP